MNPFSRLTASAGLFRRSPEKSARRRTTAKLGTSHLDRLEERTVPAIIGSQLPNFPGGGQTSGTAPRSTIGGFVFCDDNQNGVLDADLGEHGIAGVTVRLVRVGTGVVRVAQTTESGLYFFGDLKAGAFRIVEVNPPDTEQGQAFLGTVGGVTTGRVLSPDRMALRLRAGVNAVDYNFSEVCLLPPGGGVSPTEEEPGPTPAEVDADCPTDDGPFSFTVDGSVVNITGTGGGDVFRILAGPELTISFSRLDASGTVVTDSRTFAAGTITEVNVDGQSGDDRLILDNAGGLLGITVNYNGGFGTDTLRLRNGVAASEVVTAGQGEDTGSLTFTGSGGVTQTINFEDIGLIADTVVAQDVSVVANNFRQAIEVLDGQVWGTATTTRLTGIFRDHKVELCHHTGSATNPGVLIDVDRHALPAHLRHQGGADEVLSDEPPTIPIEFANKTNVSIFGGNGNDFFLVNNPTAATGLASLTIDGANGPDVVNVQAAPVGVSMTVNNVEEESGSSSRV